VLAAQADPEAADVRSLREGKRKRKNNL
jgi:hypothetical protein